jgi:hypothetical protein
MGGTGSGRWTYYDKKRTVEECWAMSISEVDRVVDFSKPGSISHLLRPTIPKTGKRSYDIPEGLFEPYGRVHPQSARVPQPSSGEAETPVASPALSKHYDVLGLPRPHQRRGASVSAGQGREGL